MNLYLARHTETNYNVLGLSNSDPKIDVHLTSNGIKQAKTLAAALQSEELDIIYTSELPRTIQTAKYITKGRTTSITHDSRLNDLNMGYEGKRVDEYHESLLQAPNIWSAKFNDGESLLDLDNRVASFLSKVLKHDDRNILIVSHYTVLQLMIGQIKHIDRSEVFKIEIIQGHYIKIEL